MESESMKLVITPLLSPQGDIDETILFSIPPLREARWVFQSLITKPLKIPITEQW